MEESQNSLSDDIKEQTDKYQKKANDLLKKSDTTEKEVIEFIEEVRNKSLYKFEYEETQEKLLDGESFEIIKKENINPIFLLNLINCISIINFVWLATKKNIKDFHNILLKVNIMFSYLKRNEIDDKEGIDYILLTSIPLNFYESITKYGKSCFQENYKLDRDYLSSDRNNQQIGLVYQENTIVQINSLLNDKAKEAPRIMYYIEHAKAVELFKREIFNSPSNFPNLKYESSEIYMGYNEIDLSFFVNEDINIHENFIFNKIIEKEKVIEEYVPKKGNVIRFCKDKNIFIEMKSSLNEFTKEDMTNIKKISNRFSNAYNNIAFNSLEKIFFKCDKECYLMYDRNRNDGIDFIKNNQEKDVNIVYNSGYVQLSSIVSLQNQIRQTYNNIDNLKNELHKIKEENKSIKEENKSIKEENKSIKEENKSIKEEIKKQNEDTDKKLKLMKIENKIDTFKFTNDAKLSTVQGYVKKVIESKLSFKPFSKVYDNLKYVAKSLDDEIIRISESTIGQLLNKEDEIKQFFKLLQLLDGKIARHNLASDYYISIKSALTGPDWKYSSNPQNYKFIIDLFSNYNVTSSIMKDIIKFVVLLEIDKEIEYLFFEAVLYCEYILSESDKTLDNYFVLLADENNVPNTICNFIKILNLDFRDKLINLKKIK